MTPTEQAIADVVCPRKGHFELESGHHGDLWLDLDALFRRPARLRGAIDALAAKLAPHRIDAVCGPQTGGALIALTIAGILDVEYFYSERTASRKDGVHAVSYDLPHGQRAAVRGKRVAVVDDAINAGSAVRGTVAALETCGAEVAVMGALLVLGTHGDQFARQKAIPLEPVARLSNRIWEPAECPMCSANVPLERLSST